MPAGMGRRLLLFATAFLLSLFVGWALFSQPYRTQPRPPVVAHVPRTETSALATAAPQVIATATQAAGGALTGMVRNDPLTPVVVGGQFTGTTMTLTLRPADWADNLQLTGELSGSRIAGKAHHLGGDDCTFTMVRTAGSSA